MSKVIDINNARFLCQQIDASRISEDFVNYLIEELDGNFELVIAAIWGALEGAYGISVHQGLKTIGEATKHFEDRVPSFIHHLPELVSSINQEGRPYE